jgi:hypothetical protein
MSTDGKRPALSLAMRREALVAQCAHQRLAAGSEARALIAPLSPGGLRQHFGSRVRLPLTIAGVVLGMIATRRGRALPMISAGLSLWKLARSVLSGFRRPPPGAG